MPHKTSPILKTLTSKVVISLSFSISNSLFPKQIQNGWIIIEFKKLSQYIYFFQLILRTMIF